MDGGDIKEGPREGNGGREETPEDMTPGAGGLAMPSELDEVEDEGAAALGPAAVKAPAPVAAAKASVLNRGIARAIDILFALLLARLPGYIGFLSGLLYVAIADGLMGGRSIGKRIIGLRVVLKKDPGRSADFRTSILRNSTIGLLYILSYIPYAGWALALVGLGIEGLLIVGSPEGMRLGDEIAQTIVKEETKG
jgi:uncharacterized RDD family membrane protein YckC